VNAPAQARRSLLASKAAWIGLALLGILAAAAISIAASNLSSQQIGISSEPLSAGRNLAPPVAKAPDTARPAHGKPGERRGAPDDRGGSPESPSATSPEAPFAPSADNRPTAPSSDDDDESSESPGFDADD
jgi:hypothetical protein